MNSNNNNNHNKRKKQRMKRFLMNVCICRGSLYENREREGDVGRSVNK